MKDKLKRILISYGITIVAGLLITALVLWLRDYSNSLGQADKYHILSDAFTIPGVLIFGIGCISWVSFSGFFDSVTYIVRHTVEMLIPGAKKKDQTFYDYKTEKAEKRGERKKIAFLLITGIAFILVAVIFLLLFNKAYAAV